MLERLADPTSSAQILVCAFLAILFLQSGLDKVIDFRGNLAWLTQHFAKSPLRGQVPAMLVVVTITEIAAGGSAALGLWQLLADGNPRHALWGAQLAALNIVMLFFGQRLAKDYTGAAALVPYFILSVGAIVLMGL